MPSRIIHTDETKEIARTQVAAGEAISRVAKDMGISKSTLHGWITVEDKGSSQELRESRKLRFINKAWDIIDQFWICPVRRSVWQQSVRNALKR